jgi:hypothetical protein
MGFGPKINPGSVRPRARLGQRDRAALAPVDDDAIEVVGPGRELGIAGVARAIACACDPRDPSGGRQRDQAIYQNQDQRALGAVALGREGAVGLCRNSQETRDLVWSWRLSLCRVWPSDEGV